MALDINGYNASFNAFVKFADDSMRTNAKAVARFGEGGAQPLEGRTIVAVDPKTDKAGKWGRSLEQQDLNNKIRTAFRSGVDEFFGRFKRRVSAGDERYERLAVPECACDITHRYPPLCSVR